MSGRETNLTKNMSYDRIIKFKSIGDTKVDQRLVTGENKVHAVMDPEYGHWTISYEHGTAPTVLQQKFTSFPRLIAFVTDYYRKRNLEIIEIIDT